MITDIPTVQQSQKWWMKMKKFPYVLEDHENVSRFIRDLREGVVVVKDYGIYYLTDINVSPHNAYGHCFFWDRRTKGRAHILREMLEEIMPQYDLIRVTSVIPITNRITALWLEKVGFNLEGIWRAAMVFNGKLYDGYQYAYYIPSIRKKIEFTPSLSHLQEVSAVPSQ